MYHTYNNWFYSRIKIDNRSAGLIDIMGTRSSGQCIKWFYSRIKIDNRGGGLICSLGTRSSGQCINGSTVESKQTTEVQDLLTFDGDKKQWSMYQMVLQQNRDRCIKCITHIIIGSTVESEQTTEVQELLTFYGDKKQFSMYQWFYSRIKIDNRGAGFMDLMGWG